MPDLKKMLTLEALSAALPSWLKRSTKPDYNADEIDTALTVNQFVTATDKANWNAKGTYSKPSGGIPKSDLSSSVQTSLNKADSALQSETDPTVPSWAKQTNKPSYTQDEVSDGSTYKRVSATEKTTWNNKGTYSKPSGGIPKTDLASAVQTSLGKADTALQSFTETDPTVPSWAKQSSKPSYTASEVGAIATSAKGAASGVAELDANGKVPSSQLPSYVDDVLEYSAKSSFPATGETGKIYVDTSNNKTYRWSGSAYVEISPSLALGTTSSTAYRGDRGDTAYKHSQKTSGNPHNVTKSDVGLGNVGNFKAVSTVASQGLSDTEKANARTNIGAGTGNGTYSKPSGGIPKSDLATAVQTSLEKADSALQSYTETDPTVPSWAKASSKPTYTQDEVGDGSTYKRVTSTEKSTWNNKGTYSKPSGGIPKSDLASAVQTSLSKADTALQSFTETDPTVPSWAKQSSKPSYTASEVGAAASSHTHGNIQNGGTLQTNDIAIASGDKLVITDSSDSSKIARASLSFDGSTTSQALTKAGSWKTFNNYTHPTDGANTGSFGPSASVSPGFGGTFSVPYVTVNEKGHVTAASTKTITMPAFTATPYTQPTKHSNITSIDSGGYIQIGKLVIVNMRFTVGTACGQYTDLFTDLPLPLTPLSGGSACVACSSNNNTLMICANGRMQNYDSGSLAAGVYVVSTVYIGQ